jgi:hypothetical protein
MTCAEQEKSCSGVEKTFPQAAVGQQFDLRLLAARPGMNNDAMQRAA